MPSWWDRFAGWAKGFSLGPAVVDPADGYMGKDPGVWNPPEYGHYMATSVGVYACANLRARLIASLPPKLYKMANGGERTEVTVGPLVELLAKVNPFWTFPFLLQMTELALCNWGEAFWVLNRGQNGRGIPTEIWWASPAYMRPVPHPTNYLSGYVFEYNGHRIEFAPDEVVWLRFPNINDEFEGLSPIAAARMSIDLGRYGLQSNANLFKQGMQTAAIISPADPNTTWKKEQVQGLEAMLGNRFRGVDKAHKFAVLSHQMRVDPLGVNPKDAEFLGQMKWSLSDVCRVYQVPPILVQDLDSSTYANFEQSLKALWTLCLVPEARDIAMWLTEQLLPLFKGAADLLEFDTTGVDVLQEGVDAKWQRDKGKIETGVITRNDWLRENGMDPVPWGDVWWAPQGLVPVTSADITQAPPAGPVAEPPAEPDLSDDPQEAADKALRIVQSLKAWEYGGEQHTATMKAFDDRAAGHETAWAGMTTRLFEDLEADVLAGLNADAKAITKKRGAANPFDADEWERRFADDAAPALTVVVQDAGRTLWGELGLIGAFDVKAPAVTKFILQRAQRFAKEVVGTTWDRLRTSLAEGEKAGETIDQLADRVTTVMRGRIRSSAETIARTEVIGGLNGGALEAAKQSGVVTTKRWLAALDHRTRDSHSATHGEEVPLDADFSLGGPAPGQIGTAAEDVNCRCTLTFGVDAGKAIRPDLLASLRAFVLNGHSHNGH